MGDDGSDGRFDAGREPHTADEAFEQMESLLATGDPEDALAARAIFKRLRLVRDGNRLIDVVWPEASAPD